MKERKFYKTLETKKNDIDDECKECFKKLRKGATIRAILSFSEDSDSILSYHVKPFCNERCAKEFLRKRDFILDAFMDHLPPYTN